MKPVTIREAVSQACIALGVAGMEESKLEAEVLFCHVLGIDRTSLLIKLNDLVSYQQQLHFLELVNRRRHSEPIAYIIGHKEFFGLDFKVTPATLIPRPETEMIVEKAISLKEKYTHHINTIADVGTGCGAIAVALAVTLPDIEVTAIDISETALMIARTNAQRHRVSNRIKFLEGDLLDPLAGSVDIIVANLPYIRDMEIHELIDDVRLFEPGIALSGGIDGMDHIVRLLEQSRSKFNTFAAIILEISPSQRTSIVGISRQFFPDAMIDVLPDLNGNDRMVCIEIPKFIETKRV